MIEVDDKEASRIRADKRHKALLAALKGIKIPEHKETDLTPVIAKIEVIMQAVVAQLEKNGKPQVVVQKTEVNQADVLKCLSDLIKEIKELKTTISAPKQSKELSFDVIRNSAGFISSVKVSEV